MKITHEILPFEDPARARTAAQKQENINLLSENVSFRPPQREFLCSCWNDEPNDAPNVSSVEPVADLFIDHY